MRWSVIQTTQPAYTPVTLAEARNHSRLITSGSPPTHEDDALLTSYIEAATAAAENFTQRVFAQRDFDLKTDAFKTRLCLPIHPIVSVNAIKYLDADDVEQTLASSEFLVDTHVIPAVIEIEDPPTTLVERNAVTIQVTAGYTSGSSPPSADLIPRSIKQAILMATGHFYEHRESVVVGTTTGPIPMAFDNLLWPHRVIGL